MSSKENQYHWIILEMRNKNNHYDRLYKTFENGNNGCNC